MHQHLDSTVNISLNLFDDTSGHLSLPYLSVHPLYFMHFKKKLQTSGHHCSLQIFNWSSAF